MGGPSSTSRVISPAATSSVRRSESIRFAHPGHQLADPGEPGRPVEKRHDDQAGPTLPQQGEDVGDRLARPLFVIPDHTNV